MLKFFPLNFFLFNNLMINNNIFKKNSHLIKSDHLITLKKINKKFSNQLITNFKKDSINYFFFKNFKKSILINFNFFKKNILFFNFFYNYCFKKNNFIILDNDYCSIYPIYKHIYGYKFLSIYKNFFFIEPKYFILKN